MIKKVIDVPVLVLNYTVNSYFKPYIFYINIMVRPLKKLG
jgi:hypothetical protein